MFSPNLHEGGPAKGTRSSRRRQRHPSADSSVQQPKAKRQRVPLAETTFANPDSQPDLYEVKPDKLDLQSAKRDGIENAGAPRKELSVRSKKPKPGERTTKGDGSIVLVRPHLSHNFPLHSGPHIDLLAIADNKQCIYREQAPGAPRQTPRRRAK